MYFRLASMLPLPLNDRSFGHLAQVLRQAFIFKRNTPQLAT
jgi:hypothetical protein